MNCPRCGAPLAETALFCGHCGERIAPANMAGAPSYREPASGENAPSGTIYLVLSILEVLFCCWPLAIPAIIYSAGIKGKVVRGDYRGAADNASKAKILIILSAICGVIGTAIVFVAYSAGYITL